MLGFEVTINGAKLCTAGIGAPGSLQVDIVWVLRHSQDDFTGVPGTPDETMSVTVGGEAYASGEYLRWPNANLKAGDEVLLRVVEREAFDGPAARGIIDREKHEKYQRELYERLKRKYEP
jgi:hypothetical protein